MTVQVEFWQLVGLLLAFLGFVFAGAKLLFAQIDRRLETRFKAADEARQQDLTTYREMLARHAADELKRMEEVREIDRGFDAYRSALDLRIVGLGDRLARVEQDVLHAPTDDDMKRLHERIDSVAGTLKGLEGQFTGANHTLQLIHSYMLKGRE